MLVRTVQRNRLLNLNSFPGLTTLRIEHTYEAEELENDREYDELNKKHLSAALQEQM